MNNIEKKVKQFQKDHFTSFRELSPVMKQHYLALGRMLIEKEEMSVEQLIQQAHRIKPLMRPKEGSSLKEALYWTKPVPLTQSFYFNFEDESILKKADGEILPVESIEKVCEFVCFHRYGGYYGCLRPGMDEIIQQFPAYLLEDEQAEYAVELIFPSLEIQDVYDCVLDRHISTVVVYRLKNGLPPEVKEQEVIYK